MKAVNLWVTFVCGQENRFSPTLGPYPFVQLTYDTVRVGENGETELAVFKDGWWVTEDSQRWSDVIVATDY